MPLLKSFARSLCTSFFVLSSAFAQTQSADRAELALVLPDQTPLLLMAEPPLQKRVMSTITLTFPPASPWEAVAFDAEMPEHKHGMIVQASSPKLIDGSKPHYEIRGIKLHMPGSWTLKVQVKHKKSGELRWINKSLQLQP